MKVYSLSLISIAAMRPLAVGAFSILPYAAKPLSKTTAIKNMFYADEDTSTDGKTNENDFGSKMPTVYERLGFEEDKIAIGVDPNEVLQWLGNREDICEKFRSDNKGMEEDRIAIEVDKFIMDREMVEAFIAFEKRKADPRNLKEEAEANLSDPSTWGVYAVWIAGGAGFAYVKNVIVEPKYQSGEWEEIHIKLPGADRFAQAAADAPAAATVDATSPVVDAAASAASTVVDAASSAVDAASIVVDAASTTM